MNSNNKGTLVAKRKSQVFSSEKCRIITRFYSLSENRTMNVFKRVMSLKEKKVSALLDQVLEEFSYRHRKFRNILEKNYEKIALSLPPDISISKERKLLLASYFTREYSVEAAALFNPSIVLHPDQTDMGKDKIRFIMSFRATGEGHISSIEFRSGVIDENSDTFFDPISNYVETPEIHINPTYDKDHFQLKLDEMDDCNGVTTFILSELPEKFSYKELESRIKNLDNIMRFPENDCKEATKMIRWLAKSNYEMKFKAEHSISERVIFPVSDDESRGIEDARFVRFIDNDGSVTYYATYTAYNGFKILPQLMLT
ncbi:MAG: glycosidase, partial [Nitrospinota bacterium]